MRRLSAGCALVLVAGGVASLAVAPVGGQVAAAASGAAVPFDFDGDGYTDLAVGVPGEDIGSVRDAGAVQVMHGSVSGPTARDQLWHQNRKGIKGVAERGDGFGQVLASGDFDADGYADLAVGVPGEGVGTARAGIVQVLYGGSNGLTARDQLWRQGKDGVPGTPSGGNDFGGSLAVGDFDGDGYADLVIAAAGGLPTADERGKGYVVVLRGSRSGLTSAGVQSWSVDTPGLQRPTACTTEPNSCLGRFVTSVAAGDVNGDGRADLAFIGPHGSTGDAYGSWWAMTVLLGSPSGLTAAGQQLITVEQMGNYLEYTRTGRALPRGDGEDGWYGPMAELGDLVLADFNGDGRDDLAVSDSSPDDVATPGAVAVLYAGDGGFTPADRRVWFEDCGRQGDSDLLPYAEPDPLAGGDLTGDGIADLVVGCAGHGGIVSVLHGSASGLAGSWTVVTQDTPGVPGADEFRDAFGASVAVLPFAGGATSWLAVGSPGEDLGRIVDAGRVVVIPGSASGLLTASTRAWHQNRKGIKGAAENGDEFGSPFRAPFPSGRRLS